MKFKNPMIVVTDPERSLRFYKEVMGLRVIADFGASKTLTGGLALQTADTWKSFLGREEIAYGGCDAELYFEEEDFDFFLQMLRDFDVELVHPVKEHTWGQRVVRFFDPDRHVIEVGECLSSVGRRIVASGMTPEETAAQMGVPLRLVRAWIR